MKAFSASYRTRLFLGTSLLLLLALTLTAYRSSSATPLSPTLLSPATPGIRLGPQPCPNEVKDPAQWKSILGIKDESKIEKVSCGNLLGTPSLQALITVRHSGTERILDVYAYDRISSGSPKQIFKLPGLNRGDARISQINTITTAEVDKKSSINKGQPPAKLTQDLFREFQWSEQASKFVQVSFPGIYPDLTRYQAETDQQQVYRGKDTWKIDAAQTAQHLAAALLKWNNASTTVEVGGSPQDVDAIVSVKSPHPGGSSVRMTLRRFEENASGIWEAQAVENFPTLYITEPRRGSQITSPVTVKGSGNAFEGKIGVVFVLDHLSTDIGHADAIGATGNGPTTFSTKVTYTSSFQNGNQEGLLVLFSYSNADGSIAATYMEKVLIGA